MGLHKLLLLLLGVKSRRYDWLSTLVKEVRSDKEPLLSGAASVPMAKAARPECDLEA
jgi:hypothetical protein